MSGDVQPRKRKDKKRKKEEGEPISNPLPHVFSKEPIDDVNIHVHKEDGTGGGICAKIVFFILFSALIVLIGLIITEHRGLTDLDVADSESKYSQIFEGWVDDEKHSDHHTLDDHDTGNFDDDVHEDDGHTLDDHDDEHIDDDENDEHSEEHTLDDHDNEHFDDDDESAPQSEEIAEDEDASQQEASEDQDHTEEEFRGKTRYRREISEEEDDVNEDDDDDNVTESQQDQEDDSSKFYVKTKYRRNKVDAEVDSKDETQTEEDIEDDSKDGDENDFTADSKIEDDDSVENDGKDTDEDQEDSKDESDIPDDDDSQEASKLQDNSRYSSKIQEDDLNDIDSKAADDDSKIQEDDDLNDNDSKGADDEEEDQEVLEPEKSAETVDDDVGKSNEDSRQIAENNTEDEGSDELNVGEKLPEIPSEQTSSAPEEDIKKQRSAEKSESSIDGSKGETEEHTTGNPGEENSPGSLSLIIKAIIGAAIMAVGHFVLVKKWKSDSPSGEDGSSVEVPLDLSRRNTLIPPPPLQEIEHDVEYIEEEYSNEDRDPETTENVKCVTDIAKKKYEQLRSSYSRSMSPESDVGDNQNDEESDGEIEIENIEDIGDDEFVEEEEIEFQEEELEEEEDIDVDEDEYENEEYEEDEDEELMKKLEAKYGKLELEAKMKDRTPSPEESDSDKLSDDNEYEFSSITNKDDWPVRKELDEAQKNLPNNAANALKMFEKILEKYPSSPRGFYGLAQALDALAEIEKSNELLEEAVSNYLKISDLKNVPDALFKLSLERCIDRIRFRGKYGKAISVHLKLIERFPNDAKYRNQLAVTYLTIGRVEQARLVLKETIEKFPYDGCALVHYGFIWKTTDNNLEEGIYFMQKGIDTKDPCVIDGRFYFHLGDAYSRLGDYAKALKLYEDGVKHKLFLSKYQRSLYNVLRLTARPWWEQHQLDRYHKLFKDLEKNWKIIRNEGLSVLNQAGYFQDESENLRDTGDWKQFELFARGRRNTKNCNKTPFTCQVLESHPDARGCRRGQSKFSVMHPGTHVWAHCGPTNCRLRVHLGLRVPSQTFIRVAEETRSWEESKLLIFDDSFEHEVWHNGTEVRLVLIVDVWHPELSMTEKETLSSL